MLTGSLTGNKLPAPDAEPWEKEWSGMGRSAPWTFSLLSGIAQSVLPASVWAVEESEGAMCITMEVEQV